MAARAGVQPGDLDSTGATRQLETTGRIDFGNYSGGKLSIFGIYFHHRVNFPSSFLRLFEWSFRE